MSETCNHDCSSCGTTCGEDTRKSGDMFEKPNDLSNIRHTIAVVSGKGGVGKSMVTGLLSVAMARKGRHVGIMATMGTIRSATYDLEIAKLHPDIHVTGEACPMWVPLVENDEYDGPGADYFVKKNIDSLLSRDPQIDSVILGCTHYPLLIEKIRKYMPSNIHVIEQGYYVANSLQDYLNRHPEMEERITQGGSTTYLTTEQAEEFQSKAAAFIGEPLTVERVHLE